MKIQIQYCGMTGEGRTVREAKQDAARKIEAFLTVNHEPRVLTWGGRTFIAWHTPHGINSAYLPEDGGQFRCTSMSGSPDMDKTLRSARLNLAQSAADIESDEVPAILGTDKRLIDDFLSWVGFQRAYRHARAHGFNDSGAHQFGCERGSEFRPAKVAA